MLLSTAVAFIPLLVNSVSSSLAPVSPIKHYLAKRQVVVCDNMGTYSAGSSTDFAVSPNLVLPDDAYLQAFVAPKDGFLCTLSVSVQVPSSDALATLNIYDNQTPQISIVNGSATAIGSVSAR